jgi:hypothetical protein
MSQLASGASGAYASPYIWSKVYIDLKNDRAVFCENCGVGRYSSNAGFKFTEFGGYGGMSVIPGEHKFGGTMRLLGTVYDLEGFKSEFDTYVAKYEWLFQYMGGGGSASNSAIQGPGQAVGYNPYIGRFGGFTGTTTVRAYVLSWTTGTATVTATGGPYVTVLARAGFDNRTGHGRGDIQMVSPMLTRWIYKGGTKAYFTAGIGIMQLRVAPEPHEWMLLGAGLSMLGLLYRANRRSR